MYLVHTANGFCKLCRSGFWHKWLHCNLKCCYFPHISHLLKRFTSLPHTWGFPSEAGWWSLWSVQHFPDTFRLACCSPPLCWCSSCWRGLTPGCRRLLQCHVCRREIEPCRCPSWWISVAPCLPLSVRRKDKHKEIELTRRVKYQLISHFECLVRR